MNRTVERVKYSSSPSCNKKITVQSRNSYSDILQNSTHDYAVLAVPFSILKKWRIDGEQPMKPLFNQVLTSLPQALPITMQNAINNVPYTAACKVALEFRTRFWEHFENPIYGSCSTNTGK
jgi:monoamine oxidase